MEIIEPVNSKFVGFSEIKNVRIKIPESEYYEVSQSTQNLFDLNNFNKFFVMAKGSYLFVDEVSRLHELSKDDVDDDDMIPFSPKICTNLGGAISFVKITKNYIIIIVAHMILFRPIPTSFKDVDSSTFIQEAFPIMIDDGLSVLDLKITNDEKYLMILDSDNKLHYLNVENVDSETEFTLLKFKNKVISFDLSKFEKNIVYIGFKDLAAKHIVKYNFDIKKLVNKVEQNIDLDSALNPVSIVEISTSKLLVTYDVDGKAAPEGDEPRFNNYLVDITTEDIKELDESFSSISNDLVASQDFKIYSSYINNFQDSQKPLYLVTSSVSNSISLITEDKFITPEDDSAKATIITDPESFDDIPVGGICIDFTNPSFEAEVPNMEDVSTGRTPVIWIYSKVGFLSMFMWYDVEALKANKEFMTYQYQLNQSPLLNNASKSENISNNKHVPEVISEPKKLFEGLGDSNNNKDQNSASSALNKPTSVSGSDGFGKYGSLLSNNTSSLFGNANNETKPTGSIFSNPAGDQGKSIFSSSNNNTRPTVSIFSNPASDQGKSIFSFSNNNGSLFSGKNNNSSSTDNFSYKKSSLFGGNSTGTVSSSTPNESRQNAKLLGEQNGTKSPFAHNPFASSGNKPSPFSGPKFGQNTFGGSGLTASSPFAGFSSPQNKDVKLENPKETGIESKSIEKEMSQEPEVEKVAKPAKNFKTDINTPVVNIFPEHNVGKGMGKSIYAAEEEEEEEEEESVNEIVEESKNLKLDDSIKSFSNPENKAIKIPIESETLSKFKFKPVDASVYGTKEYVDSSVDATKKYVDTGIAIEPTIYKNVNILALEDDQEYIDNLKISKPVPTLYELSDIEIPPEKNTSIVDQNLQQSYIYCMAEYEIVKKNQEAIDEFIKDHLMIKNTYENKHKSLKNIYTWRLSETPVLIKIIQDREPEVEEFNQKFSKTLKEVEEFKENIFSKYQDDYDKFHENFEIVEFNNNVLRKSGPSNVINSNILGLEFSIIQKSLKKKVSNCMKLMSELENTMFIIKSKYELMYYSDSDNEKVGNAIFQKFTTIVNIIGKSIKEQMTIISDLLKQWDELKVINNGEESQYTLSSSSILSNRPEINNKQLIVTNDDIQKEEINAQLSLDELFYKLQIHQQGFSFIEQINENDLVVKYQL